MSLESRYSEPGGYATVTECPSDFCVPGQFPLRNEVETRALDLALLGFLRVSERVDLYASLGIGRTQLEGTSSSSLMGSYEYTGYSTDPVYGVGVRIQASNSWAARLQAERRDGLFGGDSNFDSISLGVEYSF